MVWGDYLTFEYGKPVADKDSVDGEVPVYGTNGQIGTSHLPALCKIPSFIIGRKGAYRGVHYSPVPFSVIDTAFYALPITDKVDLKWAYYKFLTYDINRMDSGSAIPSTDRYELYKIPVNLPDMAIQKRVVSILDSIDDKIKNNFKLNNNLEQQIQALFSCFYKQSKEEVRFTDIIQILGGGTPKTGEPSFWNGNIPFFTPKDVTSPYILLTEKTITEAGLSHCNSRLYPVNTVFVTARGTVGKVSMAGVPMAMNQSCYALVGKDIPQLLVYFYTLKAVDRLKRKASGAVFDAIVTRDFETESIFILSNTNTITFLDFAVPTYQLLLNNTIENQRLIMLRDTLLPRLMSGELDVSCLSL